MYAIIDIETTGGKHNEEGITEIAIYRFDGEKITDKFVSLINPERPIEDFVSKLTGINNAMLKNAPKFFEVAKRIVEITQDCVIVAHNADFDYRVVRTEFRRLGFDYQRNTICTVELSKKLIPNQVSYSLGKLSKALGIPLSNRHRADGDAMATLLLFKLLLSKDTQKEAISEFIKQNIGTPLLSSHLLRLLDELPTLTGVYYLYNHKGNIFYIGKNKNIQKRVNQHFTSTSSKDLYIQKQVNKIAYELTGSELISTLKEYEELKENTPSLNAKLPHLKFPYGLFLSKNKHGYAQLSIRLIGSNLDYLALYETQAEGLNTLFELTEKFSLCTKLNGFSEAKNHCYNYTIQKCFGACINEETAESYNRRVEKALQTYTLGNRTFAIVGKGRHAHEKSIILIENGVCKGYGFTDLNHQNKFDILKNIITPIKHSLFVQHLLEQHLRTSKFIKIINF